MEGQAPEQLELKPMPDLPQNWTSLTDSVLVTWKRLTSFGHPLPASRIIRHSSPLNPGDTNLAAWFVGSTCYPQNVRL